MSDLLNVNVKLTNGRVKFASTTRDRPPIVTDYIPPYGEGIEYKPLELFLISLATCAGGTVSPFLGKFHKTVLNMDIDVRGERRTEHPTSFERIYMNFTVTSPDATEDDMKKILEMTENKYCPVWAMIKGNVEVITTFEIIRE